MLFGECQGREHDPAKILGMIFRGNLTPLLAQVFDVAGSYDCDLAVLYISQEAAGLFTIVN